MFYSIENRVKVLFSKQKLIKLGDGIVKCNAESIKKTLSNKSQLPRGRKLLVPYAVSPHWKLMKAS